MNNINIVNIVSDRNSWINLYLSELINDSKFRKIKFNWVHEFNNITQGDICFLLGCSKIMYKKYMPFNKINLVVHESAVPEGRGWSPLTWQILEGKNIIPISLLEVNNKVDSGNVYIQKKMYFEGNELVGELRSKQADYTIQLCKEFMEKYPDILSEGIRQRGSTSYYTRRTPKDSELDVNKSIIDNFNLLRVVDNNNYPAYFKHKNTQYKLFIEKL